ncbi:MAG: hypothetical protein EU531_00210 [Promethearchaeota archaeon]|nr:MAG: hypothetical protein EU531_00210 [Candidatus Lokiarchaeota archaeon]
MLKKKYLIIFFFILIGSIHGLISISLNIFLTWVFIGLWLFFIIKVFENIKQHREFNSPYNTAFFVILPLFIGIFYSIWGSYTSLLGENLIMDSNFYFSLWSLIFGLPFVLYGSYSLYRCFKRYNVIYFGRRAVKAKVVGYLLSFFIIFGIILYWIIFYSISELYNSILIPFRFSLDINILLLFILTILNLIIFGFLNTQRQLSPLTREYITQRTRRINSLTRPSNQNQRVQTTNRSSPPLSRTEPRSSRASYHSSRVTSAPHSHKTRTPKNSQTQKTKTSHKIQNINIYKPKAAFLTEEDFKCIFCFKLPKFPEDKGRGIILCPNCRYPSHADEFKDWLKTSNLCSRCSAPIPLNFRRNPRIISIKNYITIYRRILKIK